MRAERCAPAAPVIVTPAAMSEVSSQDPERARQCPSPYSNARPPLAWLTRPQRAAAGARRRRGGAKTARAGRRHRVGTHSKRPRDSGHRLGKETGLSNARAPNSNPRRPPPAPSCPTPRPRPSCRASRCRPRRPPRRAPPVKSPHQRAVVAEIDGDGQRIQALFADRDQRNRRPSPRRRRDGYDPPTRCADIALMIY